MLCNYLKVLTLVGLIEIAFGIPHQVQKMHPNVSHSIKPLYCVCFTTEKERSFINNVNRTFTKRVISCYYLVHFTAACVYKIRIIYNHILNVSPTKTCYKF